MILHVIELIKPARSKEDEIHNCQCVIDSLSMDVLNTSLSHITGQDIVECDQMAILNMLEVFSGLLEYIMDKIGSDISTDLDGKDLSLHGDSEEFHSVFCWIY